MVAKIFLQWSYYTPVRRDAKEKHGTSPVLTSRQPCEQKSRRPARSVALSLDRLRATGGALPTSSPLATNIVYHTVSTPTSAKLPILSPAILPTLAKACDLWSPEPSQGLSHRQRYFNLRPVARLGLRHSSVQARSSSFLFHRHPFFDMRLIQVYTIRVHTVLGSARSDGGFDEEERHDLSHAVFYH